MSTYKISTNLDNLMALPSTDDYLFFNYKWAPVQPDIPNRVETEFTDIQQAMAVHHELWKLKISPLFKTWI